MGLALPHTSTNTYYASVIGSHDALITLIRGLVISQIDYRNYVLAGVSGILIGRPQSVLNAAARLIGSPALSSNFFVKQRKWQVNASKATEVEMSSKMNVK